MSDYGTGQIIYANTIDSITGKFIKIKMVVTEVVEITKDEYNKTRQTVKDKE